MTVIFGNYKFGTMDIKEYKAGKRIIGIKDIR